MEDLDFFSHFICLILSQHSDRVFIFCGRYIPLIQNKRICSNLWKKEKETLLLVRNKVGQIIFL